MLLLAIVVVDPDTPSHHVLHMTTSCDDVRQSDKGKRTSEMATAFMEDIFGTMPYPWQQEVISHLCCMQLHLR
jgi:hypothetical protein